MMKSGSEVGKKNDKGKLEWDLVPWRAMKDVVKVLMHGAVTYGEFNWELVPNWRKRYWNAANRHMKDWWMGEECDPDTNLPHLAHAACDVLFLLALSMGYVGKAKGAKNGR